MGLSWGDIAKGFVANAVIGNNVGTLSVANEALDGGLGKAVAYNGLFGSGLPYHAYGASQFGALDRYLGAGCGTPAFSLPALSYGAHAWGCGRTNPTAEQGMNVLFRAQDAYVNGDLRNTKGMLSIAKAMFTDMSPSERLSFVAQAQTIAPEAFLAMLEYGEGSRVQRGTL